MTINVKISWHQIFFQCLKNIIFFSDDDLFIFANFASARKSRKIVWWRKTNLSYVLKSICCKLITAFRVIWQMACLVISSAAQSWNNVCNVSRKRLYKISFWAIKFHAIEVGKCMKSIQQLLTHQNCQSISHQVIMNSFSAYIAKECMTLNDQKNGFEIFSCYVVQPDMY